MSRDALVAVARESAARGPALLVAFRIADHTNRTGWAWPGVLLLADETGYSKDTVLRSLKALEEAGELHVERSKSRRGNRYRLRLAGVPGSDIADAPDGTSTVAPCDSSARSNSRIRRPELSHQGPGTVAQTDSNLENRLNLAASPLDACPLCGGSLWVMREGETHVHPCPRCRS